MEFTEIRERLLRSIQQVISNDLYLIEHNINEPTISHRLAIYLEPLFPEFNVDCEYNGDIDADNGRKYISILHDNAIQLGILNAGEGDQELINRYVYPDIIIHRRGRNGIENNLLIIEIKKSSNQSNGRWDALKLESFTSAENENHYNYRFGVFVKFNIGEEPNYITHWYQNGQRFT
jgi:hypothetical protein